MAAADSFDSRSWKYDVFLSFRGPDTRKIFVGHLHRALERKSLTAFIDTEELPKGEVIQVLLKAIEDSKLSVVVFSQNYASSTWCLKELDQIVECMDTKKQIVVPVFYEVDPADVRYQKGKFEDAFAKYVKDGRESEEVLERWKSALKRAADLSGWDSRPYGDDAELIELVVEDIFEKLIKSWSSESESNDLVGMKYHIQQMEILLSPGGNDVRTVGIWGMGGLGKTTIARAVYDKFSSNFDACCFLENVRQNFKEKGEGQMREVLLSKILKEKVRNLGTSNMASEMIMEMLRKKKLLLVLDDVDESAQVEGLLGKNRSFGCGSRIIITTRDKHLISQYLIYAPVSLSDKEALKLFREYAKPSGQHNHLLSRAIGYAQGLPLAIKVLGASLCERSVCEWEDELERIKKFQHEGIGGVLRISFEGLDALQKDIFLDVACFFKGIKKDYATIILDACRLFPKIGLSVLADRALVTTSGYHSEVLGMHDLLQDMALAIVRRESGPPSRLTTSDEIVEMLTENTGMEVVESIDLDLSSSKDVVINIEAFVSMKRLRLLRIHYNRSIDSVDDYYSSSEELYNRSDECKQHVSGDLKSLSQKLRCLIWHGCPLKSLPSHFLPMHLVDIDMRCSSITKLWEGIKPLGKLKFINLSRSAYLEEFPNLTQAINLEKVNLEGCISLSKVDSSISELKNLVFLNLKGCKELKILSSRIGMKSLKTLELSGCSNLEDFPEISEVMEKVPRLCLDMTAIKRLHPSIKNLKGLVTLSLKGCRELESLPSSMCQLKSLRYVTLSGCSKFKVFPEIVGAEDMEKLKELHLDGTSIKEFLPSTSALGTLEVLSLRDCKDLETLPSSIHMVSLESLFLSGCSNLKKFPKILPSMRYLSELHLDNIAIEELPPSIKNLCNLRTLILRDCGEIKSLPSSIFQLKYLKEITLSGCSKFEVFPEFVEELCRDKPSIRRFSLVTLRLEDCRELRSLPSSICQLQSLRFIALSGCSKFEVFPEILEDMDELRELHLDGTSIKNLSPSIERLKRIMLLNMSNCRSLVSLPDNVCNLSYLTGITLSGCLNLHNLPKNLGKLEFLLDLEVQGSGIKQPFSPLHPQRSSATNCLVGMDRHIRQMQTLLCPHQVGVVLTVGICGMCGIGKTTIAIAVYDEIAPQFEHCCFLENVNEGFTKHGAVYMQEKLLSGMLKEKVQSLGNLNAGYNMTMEKRIGMKKVLVVLDDVRNATQIEALLGKQYSFDCGSRIIITTREETIMSGCQIYRPKLLDDEALKLFRHFAFRTINSSDEYDLLSRRAIECAQRLPLALQVLGSFLSDRSIEKWEVALKRMWSVESVFDCSFDYLHDSEKTIFLDVACFFKGREKDYVTEILRSCGFFPYSGLRVLIDRSLLTISRCDGTLKMYDSIHEVGRERARLESIHDPLERSRLWSEEAISCWSANWDNNNVEAINLDLSNSKEVNLSANAFVEMKKLRLLQILDDFPGRKQLVSGNFEFLSHELRCLIWHRCPLRSLPSNFHPWNLVELDMRGSSIEQLCEGTKLLRNLKFINLSHCPCLQKIPDLTEATNLEKLILDGCTILLEVHPSVWNHKNLVLLSLEGCRELKIHPASIHMNSLKTLNLSGCLNLEKFPEISEVMMELSELGLDETAIKELPSSIERLQRLNVLSMRNCTSLVSLPDSLCSLAHLTFLNLSGCSKLTDFPDSLRIMQSLTISGIEQLPLSMRSKETEEEGVIGVSEEGSSSESREGRVYNHTLWPVPEPQRERRENKETMEAAMHGEDCLAGGGMLGSLCSCLSWLGELCGER